MNMKKYLSLIFGLTLIFALLIGCGNGNESATYYGGDSSANIQGNGYGEEEIIVEEVRFSSAPAMDLGGRDFVIMVTPWDIPIWNQRDIFSEGETGEAFNDAVFRRNTIVEEKFNITIVERVSHSLEGDIRTFVQAGDDAVDAITPRLRAVMGLSTGGTLVDFMDLTYIDLTAPWWDYNSVEALSVAGRLFAACSDITVMDNDSTSALVFNKGLLADYALDDPYQMVRNGTWTLDRLQELTRAVSEDLNGDGIMDNNDRFGLLYQRDSMTSFLTGSNAFIAQKDENDIPVITLHDPHALDVLNYLFDFLYDEQYCFHVMRFFDARGMDFTAGMTAMFQNDQALFMWIRMADVQNLRAMDTDFGILPIPKWNEAQENYLHNVNPHVGTVTAVPRSAGNIDASGAVLDTLASVSRHLVIPAYYDIQLTTQIARDEESSEMLDIIFTNRRYDIGDIFDFGGLGNEVIWMSQSFERDIVSRIERLGRVAERAIERMVEAFINLD